MERAATDWFRMLWIPAALIIAVAGMVMGWNYQSTEQSWLKLQTAGLLAFRRNDMVLAEEKFQSACSLVDGKPAYTRLLVESLFRLATLHQAEGHSDRELALLQRALKIARARLPADDPDLVLMYNKLVEIASRNNDWQTASAALSNEVEIRKHLFGAKDPSLLALLVPQFQTDVETSNFGRAETELSQLISISDAANQKMLGTRQRMHRLGEFCLKAGFQYEKASPENEAAALQAFSLAKRIFEQKPGGTDVERAAIKQICFMTCIKIWRTQHLPMEGQVFEQLKKSALEFGSGSGYQLVESAEQAREKSDFKKALAITDFVQNHFYDKLCINDAWDLRCIRALCLTATSERHKPGSIMVLKQLLAEARLRQDPNRLQYALLLLAQLDQSDPMVAKRYADEAVSLERKRDTSWLTVGTYDAAASCARDVGDVTASKKLTLEKLSKTGMKK